MKEATESMIRNREIKVALVCDWLTVFGGAEKVLWQFHRFFPKAPIFTTIWDDQKVKQFNTKIITSHLQNYPGAKNHHQWYIPLMPMAIERMNLRGYDLVISSSSTVAKAVLIDPETIHICYCHTPLRYAWQPYLDARGQGGFLKNCLLSYLRLWDRVTADRVDYFLANSHYVATRIKKFYHHEAQVLYPPVDTNFYNIDTKTKKKNYFLFVARLIPYKKTDLLIEVFNELGWPLKIVGNGPEKAKLEKRAKRNIEFISHISDEGLCRLYREAQALVFPGEEDFGIVMAEALACGTPVLAYGRGGALEIVVPGKNGELFFPQTKEAFKKILLEFKSKKYIQREIRKSSLKFSEENFRKNFGKILSNILKERNSDGSL